MSKPLHFCSFWRFWLVVLIAILGYGAPGLSVQGRDQVLKSIKEPSFINKMLSRSFSTLSFWTPESLGYGIDIACSFVLRQALKPEMVRSGIKKLAFGNDDLVFAQYDRIIGVHKSIPVQPLSFLQLMDLLKSAKAERMGWENGHMSGGIYDGSLAYMDKTTDMFLKTLLSDDTNRALLLSTPEAKTLLIEAFRCFHTSNPLHGTVFPLSVKAMREFSSMMAELLGFEHAIIASGSNESLRLGLRALKNRQKNDRPCHILAPSDQAQLLKGPAQSLNAFVRKDPARFIDYNFAAFILDNQPLSALSAFAYAAFERGLEIHLHLGKTAFRNLFDEEKAQAFKELLNKNPHIVSVSLDTEGIFWQGTSATIFTKPGLRFDALEAHLNWPGGVYTGINSAGSLPGIDYLLAYLQALFQGKTGLKEMIASLAHERARNSSFEPVENHLHQLFEQGASLKDAQVALAQVKKQFFHEQPWRDSINNILVDINLRIFRAPKTIFTGRITSGGTESIRQALQLYFNKWKARNGRAQPIFLMTNTAHIAFDRHLADLDARIVRIKQTAKTLDTDHLVELIKLHGAENIAGIVASTPNFPLGSFDNIKAISQIAHKYGIPFHVDACLGAYVNQFIDSDAALFLNDESFRGVSSWSADLHKYGLVSRKGLSFLGFHRDLKVYADSSLDMCAPRSTAQLEMGFYSMIEVGLAGYKERAQRIVKLGQELTEILSKMDGLELVAKSKTPFVIAFTLKAPLREMTYTLGSIMDKLGWHLSTLGDHKLHIALTNAHTGADFLKSFTDDLRWSIDLINQHPHMKQSSSVGIYGMAADFSCASYISGKETKKVILSTLVKLYADNLLSVK